MGYSRETIRQIYNAKTRALLEKIRRDKEDQAKADFDRRQKANDDINKLITAVSLSDSVSKMWDNRQASLLKIPYGGTGEIKPDGVIPTKYIRKQDRPFLDVIKPKNWWETAKRLTPRGSLEKTKGFKAYQELEKSLEGWINPETGEQGTMTEYKDFLASQQPSYLDPDELLDQDVPTGDPDELGPPTVDPAVVPEVGVGDTGVDTSEVIIPDVGVPDVGVTDVGVIPTDTTDLDEALEDLQKSLIEGDEFDLPEGGPLMASAGMSDAFPPTEEMGDVEAVSEISGDEFGVAEGEAVEAPTTEDVEAPTTEDEVAEEGGPLGRIPGKAYNAYQTLTQLQSIGNTFKDKNSTDLEKALAGAKGTKILTDLAMKHAGEKSAEQYIKAHTVTDIAGKKTIEEGAKLSGKQAASAGLGAVLGGYTMVTEAKATAESWEEKDYDEAYLHSIGAVAGGLQTAGGAMMASGIGAPLGAIVYGVGTAASLISGVGLFLESAFGGDAPGATKQFDPGEYLSNIGSSREAISDIRARRSRSSRRPRFNYSNYGR